MKTILFVITLSLFTGYAIGGETAIMMIKTKTGVEKREVTRKLDASYGVPTPAGKTFYYGGTLEDGVRTFNADGTGTYIDGTNKGTLEWGFVLKDGKPVIKSFREWGEAYHTENDQPAVQIYINFKGANKDGESYTEVVGCPIPSSSGVFLSPIFATKE